MTPSQEAGWKVGDRGVYFKDAHGVFSNNATVEFYGDDGTYAPLFKLIKGSCAYNHCDGEPGAYASLENVRKIEEPAQEEWKVGDRAVVIASDNDAFTQGSVIQFDKDRSSTGGLFKLIEGDCKYNLCSGGQPGANIGFHNIQKLEGDNMNTTQTNAVTLQGGDYVEAHLIKNEEQFDKLVEAFVEAGAREAFSPIETLFEEGTVVVGWDARDNRVYAPTVDMSHLIEDGCFHRSLTPEQVLGGSSEEPQKRVETTLQSLLTEEEWQAYCKAKMIESGLDGDSESFEVWAERYYKGGF